MNKICQTSGAGKVHMHKTVGKVHIFRQTQNLQECNHKNFIQSKKYQTDDMASNKFKRKCSNGEIYKVKCLVVNTHTYICDRYTEHVT
jgi:hypothetical protein